MAAKRPTRSRGTPSSPVLPREVTLDVDRLVPGGQGLCRTDDGVVFVDGVAAGERVLVRLQGRQGGAARGDVLQVLTASPDRIALDCVVGASCGGCDWLHLSPSARSTWKWRLAADALRRVGRFGEDDVARVLRPLVTLDDDTGLLAGRRRVRVTIGAGGRGTFSAARSHARVPVSDCGALHPGLRQALAALPSASLPERTEVRQGVDDRGHVVAAVSSSTAARKLVDAGVVVGAVVFRTDGSEPGTVDADVVGDPFLRGEVSAGRFPMARSDAATFAQATRGGGQSIIDAVMAGVDDVIDGATVLELFCGAGHLTLPLASRASSVAAVEGDGRALRHLDGNRSLVAGVITTHISYIDADVGVPEGVTVVVVDPPRTGLVDGAAIFVKLASTPTLRRLVMVSCDPATGARDLRAAVDAGFILESVIPIDAFPRTHHLEWVAKLSRG
jgi:23S rRNA (uracil1939-C5)-methyltransferase